MSHIKVSRLAQKLPPFLDRHFSGESISYKQVFAIIVPILVDQAFVVGLSLLNTAMVSSSGMAAVSAVSMVDSLNVFLLNVFIAVATGGTVIVAQYYGGGNGEMVQKAAAQAISAVALLSVAVGAVMIVFHTQVLGLLFGSAEPDVFANAQIYLIGSCISYPFIAVVEAVCGALRGVGETRSSLLLSIITNGSYVLFNVLFLTILHLGVQGLVISLVLARAIGMVCSLVYLIRRNQTLRFSLRAALHINFPMLKKIFFIGLPFAAEQMFFNGGKILTQTYIVQLGTLAMSANAISGSINMLFQIGGNALNLAVVTVVGQCMGRRNIQDARKFIRSFLWLSSLFYVVSAALLLPLFPLIVRMFSPPEEIVGTIFSIVLMAAICQPVLWPVAFITPSALRAAGDSSFTSIASLISMWCVRVVLGYVLGITLHMGVIGVWAAMIIEWGVRGIVFSLRKRGDKWYRHHLID
jgi:putative MATE family efflux protein